MTDRAEIECVVLIASPSVAIRTRFRLALGGKYSVHQVAHQGEMVRKVAILKPSVLFIDLDLPGLNGIKRVPSIQRMSTSTKILFLSDAPDQNEAMLALEAGAKGYCHKDLDHILIRKAVEMVQKGEIWVERGIIPRLIKEIGECKRRPNKGKLSHLKGLTHRQNQIAFMISHGAANKQIANSLNITEATVKAHVHVIFRKLGVSDRLGLALLVRDRVSL
jgi:two-component system nitrate/nitrite response regulator NarL